MIRLAARTLRYRLAGSIATFVALFLGAAIIMACGGLMESGLRLVVPPQQLSEADVVVTGQQRYDVPEMHYAVDLPERVRIDAELVDTLGALSGVQQADGHVFDRPAPAGTLDAVGVVAEAGASIDQVRELIDAELPRTAVTLVGDERGLAEKPEATISTDILVSLAGVFGAMAIMVSLYGVASMLALSIQQRQRELALLRATGSTPGQLRKLILGETILLAAFATVLAIIPGRWLGRLIFDRLVETGMVTESVEFRLGWIPLAVAIGSAMLAAVGGALIAGHSAAKTRPTQALAAAGLPERRRIGVGRTLFGLVLLAGSIAMIAVTMTVLSGVYASATGMPAVIVLAIALAVLSPLLTRPLAALLRWPLRALTGQAGRLAMLNVRAGIDRASAVVAPIIVLTAVASGMLYMQGTEQRAVEQEYADSFVADAIVTSDHGVDSQLAERITALPGVADASEYVQSIGFIEQPRDDLLRGEGVGWTLQGVTPDGAGAVAPIDVTDGALDDLHGPAVAIGARQAGELGVKPGDPITLRMGDNTALELEIVALFTTSEDDDTLLLPADVLATHTTAGHPTEILVAGDNTLGVDRMISGIEELTATEEGVSVTDRKALFAAYAEGQETQAFATYTIVITIVTYTAISAINALASSTSTRRREFGLQRLTGSTRGQIMRMLAVEGLLIAVIGVLLGTVAAIATILPFEIGRTGSTYSDTSPLIYIGVVSGTVLLTLLATLVPGWLATRQRPIDAAKAAS